MRRRRATASNDSFDLLLDTITNTFGGTIFLAILVALLVGTSHPKRDSSATAVDRLREARIRRSNSELTARRDSLLLATAVSREVNATFGSGEQRALLASMQQTEETIRRLKRTKGELEVEQQQIKEEVRESIAKLATIDETLTSLRSELTTKQQELTEEKRRRTNSADLPKEKRTFKSQVVLLSKGGSVAALEDKNSNAFSRTINMNDFEKTSMTKADVILMDGSSYRLQTGKGIELGDPAAVAQLVAQYSPSTEYVAIVIWEDSFEHFSILREACVGRRMEYRIIPMRNGESVREGAGSPASMVQ